MKSSLKERFARLGQVRDVRRVGSGSPVDLVLRPGTDVGKIQTVSAAMVLARRGVSMLRAKRAIEGMLKTGDAVVHAPKVERLSKLASELNEAGITAKRVTKKPIKVQTVREDLQMTQEEFALRYGFALRSVQNWERGHRKPPPLVSNYLRVIQRRPREAGEALEEDLQS